MLDLCLTFLLISFLIRFSQFFISPLVKMEAMEREVQAVDSGVFHSNPMLQISSFTFFLSKN